jgi:methyl-accepting chemotaxis protein
MRNLSILKQVLSIVGLAIIGFLIVGGVYFRSDSKVSAERELASAAGTRMSVVQSVQYQFLNARRREKDFLLRRDEK